LGFKKIPNETDEEIQIREMRFRTFDQHLKRAQLAAEGKIDPDDKLGDEILTDSDEESCSDHEPNEEQKAFKDFLIE
jgi:hypothetical protein